MSCSKVIRTTYTVVYCFISQPVRVIVQIRLKMIVAVRLSPQRSIHEHQIILLEDRYAYITSICCDGMETTQPLGSTISE